MAYTVYSKNPQKTCLHKEIMFRYYKRFNIDTLRNALSQNDIISNTSWSADQLRLEHRHNPWMNSRIIELINKRDYLKRKAIKYKNEETWLLYRHARNDVTEKIKCSKRQYYENSIQESRQNPTKIWTMLKQLT